MIPPGLTQYWQQGYYSKFPNPEFKIQILKLAVFLQNIVFSLTEN